MARRNIPAYYRNNVTQKQIRLPAPIGGLNLGSAAFNIPIEDAFVVDNVVLRPFGLEVRKGWRYWVPAANNFTGEVRTLMSFNSSVEVNDRLFAAPNVAAGTVYNVTTPNVAPTVAFIPTTPPTTPGEWYSVNYRTPGGNFLCAVSAGAGYFNYSTVAGWVEVASGSGAGKIEFPAGDTTTTKDFATCFVWKNRLWFIKKDSSVAYYLPVQSITGKVVPFDFGPLLAHGGSLAFGADWTYDGGGGMDDFLIIMGTNGDMLVYQGTDPAAATTFEVKGVWYAGRLPGGRRGFCQHGGDLLILTEFGVQRVSDYVSGRISDPIGQASLAPKFNPWLARLVTRDIAFNYWFILPYPTEELLYVGSPIVSLTTGTRLNYLMNALTNNWSSTSGLDTLCAVLFQGRFMYGTRDGKVLQGFYGVRDGDNYTSSVFGNEVTAQINTGFYDYGSPTANKTATRVRLCGITQGPFAFFAKIVPEYNIVENQQSPPPNTLSGYSWDVGLWNQATWEELRATFHDWFGVAGFGKKLALQLSFRSQGGTVITDYEVTFKEGIGL